MSDPGNRPPIIIRRKKVVHGHHGGAWKIALADFMTALMALFLVLWILSTANEEQRQGVADYFSAPLTEAIGGGERAGSSSPIPGGGPDPTFSEGERARIDPLTRSRPSQRQQQQFDALRARIEQAIDNDEDLAALENQVRLEITREGLRIQLLDTARRPMFDRGSEQVEPYMRTLLRTLAPLLNEVPNALSIAGHTDSVAYSGGYQGYSNWELSSDRANASRRELVAGGLSPDKLLRVSGFASRVPRPGIEADDAANRRIELVLLLPEIAAEIRNTAELPQAELPESGTAENAQGPDVLPQEGDTDTGP